MCSLGDVFESAPCLVMIPPQWMQPSAWTQSPLPPDLSVISRRLFLAALSLILSIKLLTTLLFCLFQSYQPPFKCYIPRSTLFSYNIFRYGVLYSVKIVSPLRQSFRTLYHLPFLLAVQNHSKPPELKMNVSPLLYK